MRTLPLTDLVFSMRWFTTFVLLTLLCTDLSAHHPDRENQRIWPRIDLIPPLGVRLSASYSRLHNRPSKRLGRTLYYIAPSSREAMSWHDATHQKAYELDRGRLEKHFFYPKPWEGLELGPRAATVVSGSDSESVTRRAVKGTPQLEPQNQ